MADETRFEGRDPFLGRLIAGKYRVDAFLGAGAMGRVYRATQRPLDKLVAVKILNANLLADVATQQRFLREAQAASRFDHPNSVTVFDFGREPDGVAFIVMEYLRGESLEDLIQREGALSPARCVAIMAQVLAALSEAHQNGIVHRDLKPENIMLVSREGEDGDGCSVKVTDFGIARLLDDDVHGHAVKLTATGVISGSPAYISPEQAQARDVDGRSDLYQCGVVLFEMITGQLPFEGDSAIAVIMRHINDPRPSPRALNRECPRALERVILRAMERDPALRFADARAMRQALKVVAPDEVTATADIGRFSRPTPRLPAQPAALRVERAVVVRSRSAMTAVVAAVAVCAAGALLAVGPRGRPLPRAYAMAPVRAAAGLRRSRGAVPNARLVAPPVRNVFEADAPAAVRTPHPVAVRAPAAVRAMPTRAAVRAMPTVSAAVSAVVAEVEAPAPAVSAVVAEVEAPVAAPAAIEPAAPVLRGVDGTLVAMQVSGGIARGALQRRAAEATGALASCVFRSVEASGMASGMTSPLTVSSTVMVRDRRADDAQLSGATGLNGCRTVVLNAFGGDLPQGEDTDYEVRMTIRLAPRR